MMYQFRNIFRDVLIPSLLCVTAATSHAATCRWTGPDNGAWNNPANWSTKTVPTSGDSVIIDAKKKVSVPTEALVANLTVGAGAEIKNGAQLKVSGKTNSAGVFTGTGTLNVPTGAVATFAVSSAGVTTASTGRAPVVFAPIVNSGTLVTTIARGSRVSFSSIQNTGSAQITSDGAVTFKNVRNSRDLTVGGSGVISFARIDNAAGASLRLHASASGSTTGAGKTTRGSDASGVIHFDDLVNQDGADVTLLGDKNAGRFDGDSISNQGELQISGAQVALENGLTNEAGATLTLDSSASVFSSDSTAPSLQNAGDLIKESGSDATLGVDFNNTGHLIVESGTLHVQVPAGQKCQQSDGTTSVEAGVLSVEDALGTSPATFDVKGGVVNGIGTITGDVLNSGGHFKPGHSPGTITINGNYTQTANGVLDMEVGGTTAGTTYDQMIVNGTAYLDGTLSMTRWNGFVPSNGDVYTLLTYYSKSGKFAQFVDNSPVAGITYDTTLTPTDYELNCYGPTDTTAPTVSISSPANGGATRSITGGNGTASDASGLASVTCRLYRYANSVTGVAAGYWDGGTGWTSGATSANDIAATGTTSWTFKFPTLAAGRYSLAATATDTSGNKAVSPTSSFYVDPNAPSTLTIGTPASNATVSSLTQVSGTASDTADGSGISNVKYQLKRSSDSLYWNGSAWTSTAYSITTTLSGTNWTRTTNMPSASLLPAGNYSIIATATDKAGNTKSLTTVFTVSSTATA